MTRYVDYAWWQVSPAQLTSMGFSGAARYLSHDKSKDLSIPERDNLRAAGFDIFLVCESTPNRAAQGFDAGAADANFYNQRADVLGYPAKCSLAYAVDFDAAPAQVQPYFDGVASVARGRLECPYGGVHVVDGVRYRAPFAWQTAAWSSHHVSRRAGLLQDLFAGNYDGNKVLVADFGQWLAKPPPPPKPLYTEEHMPTIRIPEPDANSPKTDDGRAYEKGTVATVPGTKGLVQVAADGYPGSAPVARVAIGSGRPDDTWKGRIFDDVPVANFPANWEYDHSTPFKGDEQASVVNFGPGDVTLTAVPG